MADHDTHDHTGVPGVGTTTTTVATDAIFDAKGDLPGGTGANTAAKLSVGSNGQVLTADSGETTGMKWSTPTATPAFHGAAAYNSSNYAFTTGGAENFISLNTENHDTDLYHFTSDAALTGTVAKASGSPTITGTGTSFTTELSIGQVVTIPGTAVEVAIVSAITDNTHFTASANMANTASGQTATRRSGFYVIPSGKGGTYLVTMNGRTSANVKAYLVVRKNSAVKGGGTFVLFAEALWDGTNGSFGTVSAATTLSLSAGDSLEFQGTASGACNLVTPGSGGVLPWFSIALLGT